MNNLKTKHKEAIENPSKSPKPNLPEQNVLNKKKYFLRKDIELLMVWGKKNINDFGTNDIKKNRLYNNMFYFCYEEGTKPKELIKSVYRRYFVAKEYKKNILSSVKNNIIKKYPFELGKPISNNLKGHARIKNTIEKYRR